MNVNKKITVVIEEYTDGKYLERIINSLKRQTYSNYESIILAYDELNENVKDKYDNIVNLNVEEKDCVLKNILGQIETEYIMFLSTIIIPAPNMLDTMLRHKLEEAQIFYYPNFGVSEKGKYVGWWLEEYSYYGVLYTKEEVVSKIKGNDENENIVNWLVQCRSDYEECSKLEDAYIYRSDNPENFQLVLFDLIPALAKNFSADKELMLKLAKVYVKRWYQQFLKGDNLAIVPVKNFINAFADDEAMSAVITGTIEISEQEIQFINKYTDEECRFYCKNVGFFINNSSVENLKGDNNEVVQLMNLLQRTVDYYERDTSLSEAMNMEHRLSAISSKLELLERAIGEGNHPIIKVKESTPLAESVVIGYRNGKLGLRTMIKAIRAWFVFKIKGNGGKNE